MRRIYLIFFSYKKIRLINQIYTFRLTFDLIINLISMIDSSK